MRLSTFTDYSLRLLMYLAAAPAQRATIAEVSKAFGVSQHHMVKVVHLLGRAALLKNTRGRGGGVELARPAAAINIGEVVRITERGDMPAECFSEMKSACPIRPACRLRGALREAVDAFYRALDRYSLQDLAIQPAQLAVLLRA
jgi:Rrf2 family transcriptional regulator, nitric oxide-sensitive transcriptional repressor